MWIKGRLRTYSKNLSFKKILKKNTGNSWEPIIELSHMSTDVFQPNYLIDKFITLKLPLENVKSYTGMHAQYNPDISSRAQNFWT